MLVLLIRAALILGMLSVGAVALLAREVDHAPLPSDYYLIYRYTLDGVLRTSYVKLDINNTQPNVQVQGLTSCAPNGSHLLAISLDGLYAINANEQRRATLPLDNMIIDGITISNSGDALISMTRYENRQTPQYSLYRVNFTGGNLVQLALDSSSLPRSPVLAPDGRRIALTIGMPQNVRQVGVSVAAVDSASAVPSIDQAWSPAWSPEGDMFAFVRQIGGDYQVFIKDTRTLAEFQVTRDELAKRWPVWSPDGRHLLYIRANRFQSEAYVVSWDSRVRQRVFLPGQIGGANFSLERACFLTFQPEGLGS